MLAPPATLLAVPGLACALLALGVPPVRGGETVRDERLGFTVVLPDRFLPVPAESRLPGMPYCYARDFDHPDRSVSVSFRGCGVRVSDDALTPADIADIRNDYPGAEVVPEPWKAVSLDVVRYTRDDADGVRRVYYGTSLPLRPEAIALIVSGPADRDADVRNQLRAVLRTFDGTPSSSAPDGTQRRAGNRFGVKNKHVVLAALVVLGTGAIVWGRRRRRKVRHDRPRDPGAA